MTMSEKPSHFVAVCPNCLVSLKVRLAYSGSHVRCKHCDHKFRTLGPDHSVTPRSEEYQAGPLNTPGSEAERIDVLCPNCSASLSVRSDLAGQHVRCKQCEHKFLVKKIEGMPAQIGHADSESNLFDRPYGQPEGPQSADAGPRTADQRPESAGELAAMREENERLGARLETLQQDHAGIQSERDSLLVQLEQFRGDHDRLRSEHEQDRQELQRLRDELALIRDALGGLSPEEIVVLRDERQSLGDENQALRDQVQSLQAELLDLHDQLKADHLEAIEAQRSGLGAEFQAELEAERSRHVEQIAELHARTEADAQLVERLKAEILTIAQSRSAHDADLKAAREEIADLRAKLADMQTTKRSMSSLLEGMGIRLQ